MSLSHRQQHQLHRIEAGLLRSDPQLTAMLDVFGRLSAGEIMPAREQMPSRQHSIGQAAALIVKAITVVAEAIVLLLRVVLSLVIAPSARVTAAACRHLGPNAPAASGEPTADRTRPARTYHRWAPSPPVTPARPVRRQPGDRDGSQRRQANVRRRSWRPGRQHPASPALGSPLASRNHWGARRRSAGDEAVRRVTAAGRRGLRLRRRPPPPGNLTGRRGAALVQPILLAAGLNAAAAAGLADIAGFRAVYASITRIQWPWLGAVPAALAVSAVGYYLAYRSIYAAESGYQLSRRQLTAMVAVGFGGLFDTGGIRPDGLVLQAAGASRRDAVVRVTALAGLEQAVLALYACAAAITWLCLGRPGLPVDITLPWAVIPLPASAAAFWLASRCRTGWPGGSAGGPGSRYSSTRCCSSGRCLPVRSGTAARPGAWRCSGPATRWPPGRRWPRSAC
jgi:hypothetical protein